MIKKSCFLLIILFSIKPGISQNANTGCNGTVTGTTVKPTVSCIVSFGC
ncbi:hypothetical protein GTQ40_08865 [Flavobacteriaceae bacterium R38]|nr:hypothetical protein [Flavobacteriaceae bacterium R38]